MRRQQNIPALNCIQYKASKKIVEEKDLIKANKDGFGSKIGSITNRITAITSLMANYPIGSKEYEILRYRTQCGQALQQEEIDKAKGILPTPMPKHWYIYSENRIAQDDTEEITAKKKINQELCAHKKPYFFGYNYPSLKQEYDKYINDTNANICSITGKTLQDLISNQENLSDIEHDLIDAYKKHIPLDTSASTMNRICWSIENAFANISLFGDVSFDYSIYKSKIEYSYSDYLLIKQKCIQYKKDKQVINKKIALEHTDTYVAMADADQLIDALEKDCYSICSNELELCDILLDICYGESIDKSIVWNLCGNVIVKNLVSNNEYVTYPSRCHNGDFWCCGSEFIMKQAVLEV